MGGGLNTTMNDDSDITSDTATTISVSSFEDKCHDFLGKRTFQNYEQSFDRNESLAVIQKKRRLRRKEILRNKRLKSHCHTSSTNVCAISDFISGSSTASQTNSMNSTTVMTQEETDAIILSASQTMTAQELRKLKNRLSAERSRQRKIQLIETLTVQVFECALQYNDLLEENKTLKLQQPCCVSDSSSGLSLSSFSLQPKNTTTNNNNISITNYNKIINTTNNMENQSVASYSDNEFNFLDSQLFDLDSNEVSDLLDELLQN